MASKYSIEAVFRLIDNIAGPLDRIAGKGNAVSKALKNDFMSAQKSLDNMGKSLARAGKYAVGAGVAAVGAGVVIAAKQFIEFDAAATAATAKFKDLDVTSATYAESLRQIGKAARDVAAVTEYNAVDTAGALDKMAMAGLTSNQSMKLLMGTTNLATAAGMDLTTAVDIATDSLGAFGLISRDITDDQLAKNLDRVSDVMARTTNMFNTDMSMMFEAVKKGAPAFTAAGQSMEDFSAMVGVLASSGIKGSEAGTQLRNMIQSLAAPSDPAAKAMERLGISVADANGNFLNIIDIVGQFEKAIGGMDVARDFKNQVAGLKDIEGVSMEDQIDKLFDVNITKMGSAEKMAELTQIFGKRTVTSMLLLLAEGTAGLKDYSRQLENAGGAAANIAEAMRGSIKNKIAILKSALTELGNKFVESFYEKGVGFIEKLTVAISQFDPAPIISAMTTVASVIGSVIGAMWNMREIIMGVAIAWGIYKGAMLAAAIVEPIIAIVKLTKDLMKAQEGLNVVQAVYNALLASNPVGLIVTSIGILISLIITCEGKMQRLMGVLQLLGMVLAVVFLPALAAISPLLAPIVFFIGFIYSMINELVSSWHLVVKAFQDEGIVGAIKRIGGVLLSGLLAPIQGLLELLAKVPGVDKILGPAADKIAEFRNTLKGIENVTENPAHATSGQAAPATSAVAPPPAVPVTRMATAVAPASVASPSTGTAITTTSVSPVTQPALLNLRGGARPAPALAASPAAASMWMVPAVVTPGAKDITPPEIAAAPATSTVTAGVSFPAAASPARATSTAMGAAPPASAASPVRVPVEYVFPEMVIPPDIIKTIMLPVKLAISAALPPWRSGMIPPAPPVSRSVGQSITPPDVPMTQAEQIIYSRTDHYENVKVIVSPEEGASARIVNPPKSPHVELTVSGDA